MRIQLNIPSSLLLTPASWTFPGIRCPSCAGCSGMWPPPCPLGLSFLLGSALWLSMNLPCEMHAWYPLPAPPCPIWLFQGSCWDESLIGLGSIHSDTLHVPEARQGGSSRSIKFLCIPGLLCSSWQISIKAPGHFTGGATWVRNPLPLVKFYRNYLQSLAYYWHLTFMASFPI